MDWLGIFLTIGSIICLIASWWLNGQTKQMLADAVAVRDDAENLYDRVNEMLKNDKAGN